MTIPNWLSDEAPVPTSFILPREVAAEPVAPGASAIVEAATAEDEGAGCPFELVVALASKGFAIITGPSGTGKSREVLRLGYALERRTSTPGPAASSSVALVPIGADWTDMRRLLGYANPFGASRQTADGRETNETYALTDALRLLLRALDPERAQIPHVLVLDEMNLSHVERYFSSFLSLMEAGRAVGNSQRVPLLSREDVALIAEVLDHDRPDSLEAKAAGHLRDSGQGLTIPANLYVAGTVNVDETTYMFSPKVLDRSNVIELNPVRPRDYIDNAPITTRMLSYDAALAVLTAAMETHRSGILTRLTPRQKLEEAARIAEVPDAQRDQLLSSTTRLLDGAFKLISGVGFAFGYRVINEVFDYLFFWLQASRRDRGAGAGAFAGWEQALDEVFLQKVLPKLHGNRRQLGTSLDALRAFLQGSDGDGSPPARYRLADGPEIRIAPGEQFTLPGTDQMPRSREKLRRMSERLAAVGHVSFVQ